MHVSLAFPFLTLTVNSAARYVSYGCLVKLHGSGKKNGNNTTHTVAALTYRTNVGTYVGKNVLVGREEQ